MSRAGRKRKINAKRRDRKTVADRTTVDRGTPQLQEKRQLLSPTNPAAAENALELMREYGYITDQERDAGLTLEGLRRVWRGTIVRTQGMTDAMGRTGALSDTLSEESRAASAEKRYHEAMRALGPKMNDKIFNLCCKNVYPMWLLHRGDHKRARGSDEVKGLVILTEVFGIG